MAIAVPTKPKVLRRGEAAERLGVHPNTLAGWVERGWIQAVKMPNGETRFPEDAVEGLRARIYAE